MVFVLSFHFFWNLWSHRGRTQVIPSVSYISMPSLASGAEGHVREKALDLELVDWPVPMLALETKAERRRVLPRQTPHPPTGCLVRACRQFGDHPGWGGSPGPAPWEMRDPGVTVHLVRWCLGSRGPALLALPRNCTGVGIGGPVMLGPSLGSLSATPVLAQTSQKPESPCGFFQTLV